MPGRKRKRRRRGKIKRRIRRVVRLPPIPLAVLDTETTGFTPRVNRIIEFASVRCRSGKTEDEYAQLISIPTEIPLPVQVLTRIRPADLAHKPSMEDARASILDHIGTDTLIVGQNTPFDLGMLKGEGADLTDRPWIDTSMLASLVFPELASFSLGYVSAVLGLRHDPVHRALGDVHATLELLGRCWERLQELPPAMLTEAKEIMAKSTPGYRMFFDALEAKGTKRPQWMKMPEAANATCNPSTLRRGSGQAEIRTRMQPASLCSAELRGSRNAERALPKPDIGTVELLEEPLDPSFLQSVVDAAAADAATVHWIAVKNLTAAAKRLRLSGAVRILQPPSLLLDPAAARNLRKQNAYTADEATLLLKLAWYGGAAQPDLPIHGGEKDVWSGKLACTEQSAAYRKQFENLPGVLLLDHRQLLEFIASADGDLRPQGDRAHIVIDDASMLEDTATKAYGWYCALDTLRAASEGDDALTRFTDLLQLWVEKVRNFTDQRTVVPADLATPEARGLREQLAGVLETAPTDQARRQLSELGRMLDPGNPPSRIVWIETRSNGSQFLQSVPERIGELLRENLYAAYPTTLLIPPGKAELFVEIIPKGLPAISRQPDDRPAHRLPISFSASTTFSSFLTDPPPGKSIILMNSRRLIEDAFVKYTEPLEKKGVTLICQNLSGGQGRMTAEFMATESPAVWILTPWTYEGIELPQGCADHLIVQALPFDHPSHMVLSVRANHFANAFAGYSIPRLLHRLFRLLRTFSRHRTEAGDVMLLDERIETKGYGKDVRKYLEQFMGEDAPDASEAQMELFGR